MIGSTISHYKILEKIGEGGMGQVFKAEDTKLGRCVALKFLPAAFACDAEAKGRFIREAQAASALDHPNICSIHEVDETSEGVLFIAMACYDGATLKEKLKTGMLSVKDAVDFACQIAQGLSRAHEAGIVHRDIKPANVIVTSRGEVKLVDFGLAKLAGSTRLTKTGSTLGTAAYMSPEQARGEEVDQRTDIWSLGVVLYEMLAGRLPFKSDYDQALVYEILNVEPKPLRDSAPQIPDGLEKIVGKAMAKDPANRYQHVEEMLEDVQSVGAGGPAGAKLAVRPAKNTMRALWYTVLVVAVVVAAETAYRLFAPVAQRGSENLTVGVLPFEDQTHDTAVASWVTTIQRTLSGGISGMNGMGIFDPASLNGLLEHLRGRGGPSRGPQLNNELKEAAITSVIDGVVVKSGNVYEIHSNVIDPATGEIGYSVNVTADRFSNLTQSVDSLSGKLRSYFEMVLHLRTTAELRPWVEHRTGNVEALIAFEKAYEMQYNVKGGWVPYLRRAIELDSTFVTPRLWLIIGLVGHGKMDEANEHYLTLRRLESGASPFEQAMINWAGAFLDRDMAAQVRYLETALRYAPGNYIVINSLASDRQVLGKYREAVEVLAPVVEAGWGYSPAYLTLSECYDELHEYDSARRILEQSLAVVPVTPEIYSLLLTLEIRRGDSVKAADYENQYLQREKEMGQSLDASFASLGARCAAEGFSGAAARYFNSAVDLQPGIAWYHDSLGSALYCMDKHAAAAEEFRRALSLDHTLVNAYVMLAKVSEASGNPGQAVAYYQDYLKHDSTSKEAVEVRIAASRLNH